MNKELLKNPVKIMVELPVIVKKYTQEDIKDHIDNKLTVSEIRHLVDNPYSKIEFFFTVPNDYKRKPETCMNIISEAVFINGDVISIEMFFPDLGEPGMNITNDLSYLSTQDIVRVLDNYFGKVPKIKDLAERKKRQYQEEDPLDPLGLRLSDFNKAKDFYYVIKPKSTGVKGINYQSSKDFQSNSIDFGGDIPAHLLELSLPSDIISPNAIHIEYKIIDEAMNSIDPKNHVWLYVFYDPLHKFKEKDLEKYRHSFRWLKKGNKQCYNNAYNHRTRALKELAGRIIIIQNRQRAIGN